MLRALSDLAQRDRLSSFEYDQRKLSRKFVLRRAAQGQYAPTLLLHARM
jgi:hypothetical protein